MQAKNLFFIVPVALLLNACSSDSDYDFAQGIANQAANATAAAPVQALFDPADGIIPFPNSLLFAGSMDGTINAPVDDPTNLADPAVALNQMDGFSVTSPIVAGLSRAVDPASVVLGSTVLVFEVTTTPEGAVTGVIGQLGATDVAVVPQENQLVILPVRPLKEKTDYLVVLTNGIVDAAGVALTPSLSYRLTKGATVLEGPAAALEPVRQLTQTQLAAATGAAEELVADQIVLSWTFKTQSVRDVLQAVRDQVAPGALLVAPTMLSTSGFNAGLQGKADVYIGTLDVPYYQTAVAADDPTTVGAAINSFWQGGADAQPLSQFNPLPTATETLTIPVIMTVPNSESAFGNSPPDGGWPIVIFQHGITRNRLDALAIADSMADAGIAVIGIDMPMHGITDNTIAIEASLTAFPNDRERTFGIDVANNETRAPGPDGVPDSSGTHFYNLQNLANARDNLRQAAADLMVLSTSLPGLQGVPVNASRKTFVGHSLGGMVGTTFMSFDDSVTAATIAMSGGGIAQLLANSASFGPIINAGLEASGAPPGSAEYSQFLIVAQTVVDSADPINNAAALGASGTAVHLMQVRGDLVIPNSVATAPLSGTEPLARQLGLMRTFGSTSGSAHVIFAEANSSHGSIIDPGDTPESLAVTIEMQTQTVTFAASNGTIMPINNLDVIEAAP